MTALLYCRSGFEADCAKEARAVAARHGLHGNCETGRGLVRFHSASASAPAVLLAALPLADLVFARQCIALLGELHELPPRDRVGPVAAAAIRSGLRFSEVWVEAPDTDEGRMLMTTARKIEPLVHEALGDSLVGARHGPRLHVVLTSPVSACLGIDDAATASPWHQGIPRLKFPRGAPSRSAAKLVEALETLLSADERAALLKPGARAADLGAAPGGWSWVLAQKGLRVTSVDNGSVAPRVLATGLVEHVRADGFRYRAPQAVALVACDMVDRPQRVADLMAIWIAEGAARAAVFNLKLPMKRRHETIEQCRAIIAQRIATKPFRLALKQLYHDRMEVTAAIIAGTLRTSPRRS